MKRDLRFAFLWSEGLAALNHRDWPYSREHFAGLLTTKLDSTVELDPVY